MNKGAYIGRLGQDVKFYAAQGQKKAFCTFSLGIKRPGGWKDAQGKDITDWLDFTASGKTAELIQQYAGTKGSLLAVTDAIAMKETYQDPQSGQNRQAVKFFIKEIDLSVTFATSNGNGNGQGGNNGGGNNNGGYNNNNNSGYNNSNNGGYNNNNNNANNFSAGRGNQAPPAAPYSPNIEDGGDLPF